MTSYGQSNGPCTRDSPRWRAYTIPPLAFLAFLTAGCSDGRGPTESDLGTGVTVVAAAPATAEQGQTLQVSIQGTGFTDDAVVTWRNTGTDDARVVVDQTTLISETELLASITVDPEAQVALYDIVVRSEGGAGEAVGVRLFEVRAYTPIAVLAAHPAQGEQGRTLQVRIVGEGFVDDAVPSWERDGVADPRIVVGETEFVSETEIRATVTIEHDADLGLYDIAVTSNRKRGIGSEDPRGVGEEIFTVEPYQPEPLAWFAEPIWQGAMTVAYTINDHGLIAGEALDASWVSTAVYWPQGGAPVTFGGVESTARGSNNQGWIVGSRSLKLDLVYATPFIFEDGKVIDLKPLQEPHRSNALAINEAGTIVGWGTRDYWEDPRWPLVWLRAEDGTYGAPIELPLPDGQVWEVYDRHDGRAYAINDRGDIAGTVTVNLGPEDWATRAVLWRVEPDGTYAEPLVLGGGEGHAFAINGAGWIAGVLPTGAVLWHPDDYGRPIPLGSGGGQAFDLNDTGQIVGMQGGGAVLWTVDAAGNTKETIRLAPAPGFSSAWTRAINADGWVVGDSWPEGADAGIPPGNPGAPQQPVATLWRPLDE